ncbi:MAG: hypothetical protein ABWY20_12810, partial [Mycobacterium sp.]
PLLAGAASFGNPVAVLPVLFHLLWQRRLTADLVGSLLSERTRVVTAAVLTGTQDEHDGGIDGEDVRL